jgi:hypothetical protein
MHALAQLRELETTFPDELSIVSVQEVKYEKGYNADCCYGVPRLSSLWRSKIETFPKRIEASGLGVYF